MYNDRISRDHAVGAIIIVLFAGVPIAAHIDDRNIFGESAAEILFVLVGLGMSVGAICLAGRGRRFLAAAPGLVAGLCSVALYLYLPAGEWLGEAFPRKGELLILALGAVPGFLLFWLLCRLRGDS